MIKPLQRLLVLIVSLALFCQVAAPRQLASKFKEIKIRGYITALTSSTSFEVEDYRIKRDETVKIELENPSPGTSFKSEELRVGTMVEISGLFNEETSELKAKKVKIDLKQFRTLNVTAVLEGKPTELEKIEGEKWRGTIIADGRRIRIEPNTQVFFKLNKTEKKESEKQAKEQRRLDALKAKQTEKEQVKTEPSGQSGEGTAQTPINQASASISPEAKLSEKPDEDDETSAAEEAEGAGPLTSLSDIGPGVIMTYEGKEQSDGTVLTSKVTFVRNEVEKGEKNLWKQLKIKEKPSNLLEGKPGELNVGNTKYKVLPNQEVQDYVNRIGQSLIPTYQRNLPDGDPNKIPFRFVVVMKKGFNAGAYPNGMVIIHDDIFKILENEAQLAAVLGHEIAHATQEHSYRQLQHNKKRRQALAIASLFAAGMGYYGISNILDLVNAAMTNGYNRTMENQADRVGIQYMISAGYDPREAPRVWKLVTKKHGDMPTNFFWSTHDSNIERRSFQMLTIRNSFSNLDFSRLRTSESDFKHIAEIALGANPKNKNEKDKKTKVAS